MEGRGKKGRKIKAVKKRKCTLNKTGLERGSESKRREWRNKE